MEEEQVQVQVQVQAQAQAQARASGLRPQASGLRPPLNLLCTSSAPLHAEVVQRVSRGGVELDWCTSGLVQRCRVQRWTGAEVVW